MADDSVRVSQEQSHTAYIKTEFDGIVSYYFLD